MFFRNQRVIVILGILLPSVKRVESFATKHDVKRRAESFL